MFFRKRKNRNKSKKDEKSKNGRAVIDTKAEDLEDLIERQDPKKEFLGSMSDKDLARAISDLLKKERKDQ